MKTEMYWATRQLDFKFFSCLEAWFFFRFYLYSCLNCVHNCHGHSCLYIFVLKLFKYMIISHVDCIPKRRPSISQKLFVTVFNITRDPSTVKSSLTAISLQGHLFTTSSFLGPSRQSISSLLFQFNVSKMVTSLGVQWSQFQVLLHR